MRIFVISLLSALFTIQVSAKVIYTGADDPRLCGTMMPYPEVNQSLSAYPDSLTPVFINHLGRHGARFLSSEKKVVTLEKSLHKAETIGSLTEYGRKMLQLIAEIRNYTAGRWGALDSLGIAEQNGIGRRLGENYPPLLDGFSSAIATYVPRAAMSMYSFLHPLTDLNTDFQSEAGEGKRYNSLLRFFTTNPAYIAYLQSEEVNQSISDFEMKTVPVAPAVRLLGKSFPASDAELKKMTMEAYAIVSSLPAAARKSCASEYFTEDEMILCWKTENYSHYLKRTSADSLSPVSKSAIPLLEQMIEEADSALSGRSTNKMSLRFAHAETIMPLLSLLEIDGCNAPGIKASKVAEKWYDWYASPLASNLQIVYFISPSGKIWVRGALNEVPISLTGSHGSLFASWDDVKNLWKKRIISLQGKK